MHPEVTKQLKENGKKIWLGVTDEKRKKIMSELGKSGGKKRWDKIPKDQRSTIMKKVRKGKV